MYKKFVNSIVIGSLLTCVLLISANIMIDPYGIFRVVDMPGINQQKEGVRNNIRLVKYLELPLRNPKLVLLGSSRTMNAFNPRDPILDNSIYSPVYNLGIDMVRIKELRAFLDYAIENSDVEKVIFGIDLSMFNSQEKLNPTFDINMLKNKANTVDYLRYSLLSTSALRDSIKTLRASFNEPTRREFLSNGYRPGRMVFYGLSNYQALHYYTNYTYLTKNSNGTKYYSDFSLDPEVYEDFRQIIKTCAEKKIKLEMYFSPAHANLEGEVVRASGNWDLMKEWKKRIVEISFSEGYKIWDFSGYNIVTTEKVVSPMLYYWDSSHFTEKVAHIMLSKIFGVREMASLNFGVLLSSDNIYKHLLQLDIDRANYLTENNNVIGPILEEIEDIAGGAPLNLKKVELIFEK